MGVLVRVVKEGEEDVRVPVREFLAHPAVALPVRLVRVPRPRALRDVRVRPRHRHPEVHVAHRGARGVLPREYEAQRRVQARPQLPEVQLLPAEEERLPVLVDEVLLPVLLRVVLLPKPVAHQPRLHRLRVLEDLDVGPCGLSLSLWVRVPTAAVPTGLQWQVSFQVFRG